MGYTYKILTGTDVPLFKHLLRVFGEAFEEPDNYQSAVPGEAYLGVTLYPSYFRIFLSTRNSFVLDKSGTIINGFQTVKAGESMVLVSPLGSMVPIIGDLFIGGRVDPV
jgi:hypothetical protein